MPNILGQTLVRVSCGGETMLVHHREYHSDYAQDTEYVLCKDQRPTVDELVSYCEQKTESANYHSLTGVFEPLRDVLRREVGDEGVRRVLYCIARDLNCFMGR